MRLEEALSALEDAVTKLLRHGHTPIVLGGSNDLSYADFRSCHTIFKNCAAINIDSHLDVRDYSKGINSGTPYRMLLDAGELTGKNFAEYGIQEFVNSRAHFAYASEHVVQIYTLTQIHSQKNSMTFMDAYRTVSAETHRVYISFDMDSVKSSDAPGSQRTDSDGSHRRRNFGMRLSRRYRRENGNDGYLANSTRSSMSMAAQQSWLQWSSRISSAAWQTNTNPKDAGAQKIGHG